MVQPAYQRKPTERPATGPHVTGRVNNLRDPDWSIHTMRQEKRAELICSGVNPANATKTNFAAIYRQKLIENRAWASEANKLEKFMGVVWKTLNGGNAIDRNGELWKAALIEIGLPPEATLRTLHNLPHGD